MTALGFPELAKKKMKELGGSLNNFHHLFKTETIKLYIPVMDALIRDHIDNYWSPNKVVKVFPLAKKYTFELSCKLFMNVVDPEQIKKLLDQFTLANDGIISVPIDFPVRTAYNRGIRGGRKVLEQLMGIIKERRREVNTMMSNDVLSQMLREGDATRLLSDEEICMNLVGLLVASYETTSSNITVVMNYLAKLPHIYQEVFKEQMEIAKCKGRDELLTWEDIGKMKYSWNVACESLRLLPPSLGAFKETTTEFTYAGFTIPKGWKTFWTVYSTHMNPKYFPEPEKFDPSRFEGSGPVPYTFVPFGGGVKMCAGKEYARIQVLVFMHNVVTKFKLEKTIPNEKIVMRATPQPVYGLPVNLHPH